MNSRRFDPNALIDYDVDYYAILGVARDDIPHGITREERVRAAKVLEWAYQKAASRTHPDCGGSADLFKGVVRAHTILSDPLLKRMWESGGRERVRTLDDGAVQYEVDWDKLGTYRPGTMADTVGYGLFLQLCERCDELGLKPAFFPQLPEHNYEWDLAIPDVREKLSISLVYSEEDVLRLTSGEDACQSLPFKIYVCFPRSALTFIRLKSEHHVVGDRDIVFRGRTVGAEYCDFDLLETTRLEVAQAYLSSDTLSDSIGKLRSGELQQGAIEREIEDDQHHWLGTDQLKSVDTERIKRVLRARSYEARYDARAADFLSRMREPTPISIEELAPLPSAEDL